VRRLLDVPDSLFLNGFTPARPGFGYCVDSLLGAVFEIDLARATSRLVLRHELLGKISAEPMLPGVNGVKIGDDALWLTNTDRALVLRAGLNGDGPDGRVEIAAGHLRGDDLALDDAGNLYVTTHIHNTLVRLDPDGRRVALAGPDQGMHGSTACAFGVGVDDHAVFVTTTGGIVMPVDDTPREAKLVRLDVGRPGRPPTFRT
jgi:sugar lactone lactonase YvrE